MNPAERRIARLREHIVPAAPAAPAARRSASAPGSAPPDNPFDDVATRPLTWSRALALPMHELYRAGPLSPRQWREWWRDGFTVIQAPPGAVDYAAMQRRFSHAGW
jgi:hypothetical protein